MKNNIWKVWFYSDNDNQPQIVYIQANTLDEAIDKAREQDPRYHIAQLVEE